MHRGQIFQVLRAIAGRKAVDVATEVGVSKSTYSMIENGEREPSALVALRLARLFDVDHESLVLCLENANKPGGLEGLISSFHDCVREVIEKRTLVKANPKEGL